MSPVRLLCLSFVTSTLCSTPLSLYIKQIFFFT